MSKPSKMVKITSLKNWFVVNVQQSALEGVFQIAKSTEPNSLSSNAGSAAQLLNGSAGGPRTFASLATRSRWLETMCQERKRVNCPSAKEAGIVR